ncbi:MAG: lipopolysaccharide biosynthesis protein [Elusimicrobiales bacterium]|nr:lipopolysaccharide biosynthesis protein [Elusimicrobiales bacterium]
MDYSTAFWFNIILAVVLYLLLFAFSSAIARFFDQPILIKITRISALGIILSSLCVVQVSMILRKFQFKRQAAINFASALASGTVGVFLAYNGFGVWALVFMTLAGGIIRVILFWRINRWRPKFIFNLQSFKLLYNYGYKIFLQDFGDVLVRNIYNPIIGKAFNPTALGYYTNANKFYEIFVRRTTIAYSKVAFPAFSSIQDQKERFLNNYSKVYQSLVFFMFPFIVLIILIMKPFVAFFLTDKWLPAVPFITLMLIDGFIFPLFWLNQVVFNAAGRSDITLKIDITKKVLTLGSIFITIGFGIKALIVGWVMSSFIAFMVSSVVISRRFHINMANKIVSTVPVIFVTFLCFLVGKLVLEKIITHNLFLIIVQVLTISIMYLVLSNLFRIRAYRDFFELVGEYIPVKLRKIHFVKDSYK